VQIVHDLINRLQHDQDANENRPAQLSPKKCFVVILTNPRAFESSTCGAVQGQRIQQKLARTLWRVAEKFCQIAQILLE
jgi:hypothetical protein